LKKRNREWFATGIRCVAFILLPISAEADTVTSTEILYYTIEGYPDTRFNGPNGYLDACKFVISTLPTHGDDNPDCQASIDNVVNKCEQQGITYTPTYYYTGPHCDGPPVWSSPYGPNQRAFYQTAQSYIDQWFNRPKVCPHVGDPIYPLSGSNRQTQDLGVALANFPLVLNYDSRSNIIADDPDHDPTAPPQPDPFFVRFLPANGRSLGFNWQGNFQRSMTVQYGGGNQGMTNRLAHLSRGDNETVDFIQRRLGDYQVWDPTPAVDDRFYSNINYRYVDNEALSEEIYVDGTFISSISYVRGGFVNFTYSDGTTAPDIAPAPNLLIGMTDHFGRSVSFKYAANGLLSEIVAPDGARIELSATAGSALSIQWPDGQVKKFVQDTTTPGLGSVVDESNQEYATFEYDGDGRAKSNRNGQDADSNVVNYSGGGRWVITKVSDADNSIVWHTHTWLMPDVAVTDPLGNSIQFLGTTVLGTPRLTSQSQPAGAGCASATSSQLLDARGNALSHDDFNGNRACYVYETSRNLRTVMLEGRGAKTANGQDNACPTDLAGYVPAKPGDTGYDAAHPERKITTQWHPVWSLKAREAQPRKITTWVYNGQRDPVAGDTPICAPGAQMLPDAVNNIAVLCRRYEQATTDATGAAGITDANNAGTSRLWTYTYNQWGQLLTTTEPKQSSADTMSHTTIYTYFTDTSFANGLSGHTTGDLQSVQDPLGNVTQYTSYDKAGRLLSSTDANGVVTTRTYWPRGWIHTVTVAPAAGGGVPLKTTYDYWPTGLLHVVTQPDGGTLTYQYDEAHRLTDVADNAGNTVHYVLDKLGNRTTETVKDASGNLAGTIARVYDNLNRLQTVTGATQ
jgi:YD repeat-containing protein